MARLPRLALANHAHLLMQRGNNGQTVFADILDREKLLAIAAEQARQQGVAVHGYALLDSEFHWLATPARDEALSLWMQAVGRAYVRYFNDRHGRSGTLWEGRYRGTLIQAERWLLPAMVHLAWAPVRAGLAADPQSWRWSGNGHYLGVRQERLLTPPAQYWALGNTPFAREAAYAELVHAGLSPADERQLSEASLRGWVLGDAAFVANLQHRTPRRLSKGRAGRRPNPI